MTDEELCGWLRSMLPASGFAPTENWAPWLGADRIEQLEREKAVVSDLWEQQKEIALGYLADCNKAADHIEALVAEVEGLREALRSLLEDYLVIYPNNPHKTMISLVDPETEPAVIEARAALGEKQ